MYLLKKNVDFIKPIETLNGATMEEEVQSTSYSFTTKQSFTRSINETQKALQLVQEKKMWSDWKISQKKFKLRICEKKKKSGRKNKYLDDEKMEWIQNWSNVTHMNPGRRGNVYIGKFNGKRKYKQKRFL